MKSYTLELSYQELVVIRVLCGSTTGSSTCSPRKYTDSIYDKTCKMLESYDPQDYIEFALLNERTIKFDDYPKTPQQLKIEELEATINEAQKQLQELKGL